MIQLPRAAADGGHINHRRRATLARRSLAGPARGPVLVRARFPYNAVARDGLIENISAMI